MGNQCVHKQPVVWSAPNKTRNQKLEGEGGSLKVLGGKVMVCIVALDYTGFGAEQHRIPALSCSADGKRFAKLARESGAEVREFYDNRKMKRRSVCFPSKEVVLDEWRRIGSEMEDDDVFVFFFAGHGYRSSIAECAGGDEARDDVMLFTDQAGNPVGLRDDDVARVLADAFAPAAHILFITDCCHCGTVCDLSRKNLRGRPIVHMAAVKDSQSAQDLGDGGAFTCALLETIEAMSSKSAVAAGSRDYSVTEVYNRCFEKHSSHFKNQDFTFEKTSSFDPDTFKWPLVPPVGWAVKSPLDDISFLC